MGALTISEEIFLRAALAAAETKKFATKDTRFCQRFAHVVRKFEEWLQNFQYQYNNFLILKKYWYSKNKFLSLALAVWGRGMLSRCSITSLANPFYSSLSHVLIVNQNYFKRCLNERAEIFGYTNFYYAKMI